MSLRPSSQRVLSLLNSCSASHTQAACSTRAFVTCLHPDGLRRKRSPEKPLSRSWAAQRRDFHASSVQSAQKDPYSVLGIKKDASQAEIKKTYFSLARKYHPDTNPDKSAKEKFVEIQEAYDILKDEKKRAAYDQYGHASQQPGFNPSGFGSSGGNPFAGAGGGNPFGFDFASAFGGRTGGRSQADLFDQLFGNFGGGRARSQAFEHGDDIHSSIGISFMEACKGTSRTINVTVVTKCGTCSGSGLKAGAKRSTCTSCGGTGARSFVLDNGFQVASTCPSCEGTGTTVPRGSQCGECHGQGHVRVKKSVKVDIPAGVEDGMTVKIPNAGDAPLSGKGHAGDLLVRVNVAASKLFRRQGSHLYHDARIPLHTALLGGRVRVPTLDGEVDVRIPAGTQQGEQMVLKGRGTPYVYNGDKGDLFVNFNVQLPRSLTKRQREILQMYADDVEGRAPRSTTSDSNRSDNAASQGYSSTSSSAANGDASEGKSSSNETDEESERKKATASA